MSDKDGKVIFEHPNFKMIFGIFGVISILIFLYKVFGKSKTELSADKSRELIYKAIKPSFSDQDYSNDADILEGALTNKFDEDESAVTNVFNNYANISDVYKIIEFYGKRTIHYHFGNYSLSQTISELYSNAEIKELNDLLKSKGINYSFK